MKDSFQIVDVSAWVGQYPFRGIANTTIEHLRRKMRKLNMVRAVVSPFEAVFWENNLDAFTHWAEQLRDCRELELWPVINPSMPGQLSEFRRLWEKHRFRGFRLTPNYHGYAVESACVAEVMDFARQRDLAAQLVIRIADERWHWMLKTPGVENDALSYFTGVFAGNRMIISGHNSIRTLTSRLKQQPRLFVDISRVRAPIFAVENLLRDIPPGQVLFGSLWPIQIIEATLWQVLEARMDNQAKDAVLRANFENIFAGAQGTSLAGNG